MQSPVSYNFIKPLSRYAESPAGHHIKFVANWTLRPSLVMLPGRDLRICCVLVGGVWQIKHEDD